MVVFELLRHTGERPFKIRTRQVKSTPIYIGCLGGETICARTHDAPINDELVQLVIWNSVWDSSLILTENGEFRPSKGRLRSIGKSDAARFIE